MAEHFETTEMEETGFEFDVLDPEEDISIFFEVVDEALASNEVVEGMVEEISTSEVVEDEKPPEFVCQYCEKVTKTKGGLKRHMSSMHAQYHYDNYYSSKLDHGSLYNLVKKAISELENDLCYPKEIRDNFKCYNNQLNESFIKEAKNEFEILEKSGNVGKFLDSFLDSFALDACTYFPTLTFPAATLLVTKLGEKIVCFYKTPESEPPKENVVIKPISKVEIDALQYLAGYVVRKLIKKARNKNFSKRRNQAIISILENGIVTDNDQTLIEAQNRGGLCSVNEDFQVIFIETEKVFRKETTGSNVRKVDTPFIVNVVSKNDTVVGHYQNIIQGFEDVPEEILTELLKCLVELYIRVRSFSFAKDIIQKYKVKEKAKKAKGSLRNNMKRNSDKKTC